MGSLSSDDDQQSERCAGSYSLSADVSESESCSSFSCRRFDAGEGAASSSMASSPHPFCFQPPPPSLMLPVKDLVWDGKSHRRGGNGDLSEVEMMMERFAKLLLGEDMSGSGKGVCTALAISNAITNLSATVFGELWRLEPLATQKRTMWSREMEWLLCVSDSIVELVPSIQKFPGGGTYEIMASRPRSDLYMNLPALKKLDAMLIATLDSFSETEFWYVDRGIVVAEEDDELYPPGCSRPSIRQEEKWWLPSPKVPTNGLSDESRKKLQQCRDCTNQILKAAMAINSSVLAEMEIPSAYLETLPKSGRACLGDIIYRCMTAEHFSAEALLDNLHLSTEHHATEVANKIEAALHVWKRKDEKKKKQKGIPNGGRKQQLSSFLVADGSKARSLDHRHSSLGRKVKGLVAANGEKKHCLAQRAESLLHSLRIRFPGLPQTALDMNKIQYNKDVGQSILESYSRVMESLAFNIMARIDDVLFVDDATRQCLAEESSLFNRGGMGGLPIQKRMSPSPFSIQHSPFASPFATPTFCSLTPQAGSPERAVALLKRSDLEGSARKLGFPAEYDKIWSYTGNLSARRVSSVVAPERD